jgi:hypothetical protein
MKKEVRDYVRWYEATHFLKPTTWRYGDEVDLRSDIPVHAKPRDGHPKAVRPHKGEKK